jgi:hypothetical protein
MENVELVDFLLKNKALPFNYDISFNLLQAAYIKDKEDLFNMLINYYPSGALDYSKYKPDNSWNTFVFRTDDLIDYNYTNNYLTMLDAMYQKGYIPNNDDFSRIIDAYLKCLPGFPEDSIPILLEEMIYDWVDKKIVIDSEVLDTVAGNLARYNPYASYSLIDYMLKTGYTARTEDGFGSGMYDIARSMPDSDWNKDNILVYYDILFKHGVAGEKLYCRTNNGGRTNYGEGPLLNGLEYLIFNQIINLLHEIGYIEDYYSYPPVADVTQIDAIFNDLAGKIELYDYLAGQGLKYYPHEDSLDRYATSRFPENEDELVDFAIITLGGYFQKGPEDAEKSQTIFFDYIQQLVNLSIEKKRQYDARNKTVNPGIIGMDQANAILEQNERRRRALLNGSDMMF